jgi:RNA polymerase sigma factor (sigma-70 family)
MAHGPLGLVLWYLGRGALIDDAGLTDAQLLDRFRAAGDEDAFEALLRRHGRMVMSVCRRVLRSHHDAEDAFQATFLVLALKARSIRQGNSVASWLYGTAYRTAIKARGAASRRRRNEKELCTMPRRESASEHAEQELEAILDQELACLPEKYREAILLVDLGGMARVDAAQRLGVPEGTLSSWLTRGRRLLARRLSARGLAVPGAAVAGLLFRQAAEAAPEALLLRATVRVAALVMGGRQLAAGVVSARVVALVQVVMKAQLLARLRTVLTLCVLVGLAAGGAGLLATQTLGAGQGVVRHRLPAPVPASRREPIRPDGERLQGAWVIVSGEEGGQPLSQRALRSWGRLTFAGDRVTRTGGELREGSYRIDPDATPRQIDLFPEANPWRGYYQLENATLKLVLFFGDERPTGFDSQQALALVFTRQAP